jgi:hypothetical protein
LPDGNGTNDFVMRRTTLIVGVGGIVIGILGIGPARAQTEPTPAEATPTQPTPVTAPASEVCPSAVAGAKTVVKETANGVQVSITGNSKAAEEIQRRAMEITAVREDSTAEHECVVAYYPGSEAAVEPTARGIKVTVTPQRGEDVPKVQDEIKARAKGNPAASVTEPAPPAPNSPATP